MENCVIVSRHPAAIEFIKNTAGLDDTVPVLASAKEEDVRGKVVYGNLPLNLACEASLVVSVEFLHGAPRGQEYTLEDMENAGATLTAYTVHRA